MQANVCPKATVALSAAAVLLLIANCAAGASDAGFQLDGDKVMLSTRGKEMAPDHNSLVIARAGRIRYRLTAPLIEIAYRRDEIKIAGQPDLIVTDYAGGAHCCYTVHVITLADRVQEDRIPIRDSELELDRSATPPCLRFHDFAFAYWNAAFADSPAPLLVLSWDRSLRRYQADIDAMRRPPPDDKTLSAWAQEVRAKLAEARSDRLDPALWDHMLDLIYSGNALAARHFVDAVWPADRPGKRVFLAEFTSHLKSGELWRRYRLGNRLGADAVFR